MPNQNSDHSKIAGSATAGQNFLSKNIQGPFGFRIIQNGENIEFKWDGPDLTGDIDTQLKQISTYMDVTTDKQNDVKFLLSKLGKISDEEKNDIIAKLQNILGTDNLHSQWYIPVESIKHYTERMDKFFEKQKSPYNILMVQEGAKDSLKAPNDSSYGEIFKNSAAKSGYGKCFVTNHTSFVLFKTTLQGSKAPANIHNNLQQLRATGQIINGTLYISAHTKSDIWDASNINSTIETIAHVINSHRQTVLGGDFNIPPEKKDDVQKRLEAKGLQVHFRQSRLRTGNPVQTFDMLVTKKTTCTITIDEKKDATAQPTTTTARTTTVTTPAKPTATTVVANPKPRPTPVVMKKAQQPSASISAINIKPFIIGGIIGLAATAIVGSSILVCIFAPAIIPAALTGIAKTLTTIIGLSTGATPAVIGTQALVLTASAGIIAGTTAGALSKITSGLSDNSVIEETVAIPVPA